MPIPLITLRPFTLQDIDAFTQAVNESVSSLQPWLPWAHENYHPDEAARWIDFTRIQRCNGEAEEFAIVDDNDRLLGGAGIRFAKQADEWSALGYWVRSDTQRQGVATRAVAQLVEFGFNYPHINQLEILAAEENYASRAVALRSGFTLVDYRYGLIVLESGAVNTAIYHLQHP